MYDEFMSTDFVQSDATRYFRPLESWISEASVLFTLPDTDIVIDDLHARDSETTEGAMTQSKSSKCEKGASEVKLNLYY